MSATWLDSLVNDHLLSTITFLPLATVLVLGLLGAVFAQLPERVWKWTALVSSLLGLGLTGLLWQRFDPAASGV